MTTIMASDDLLGLLELSDEEEVIQIQPKKHKNNSKPKRNKVLITNKSKQNKLPKINDNEPTDNIKSTKPSKKKKLSKPKLSSKNSSTSSISKPKLSSKNSTSSISKPKLSSKNSSTSSISKPKLSSKNSSTSSISKNKQNKQNKKRNSASINDKSLKNNSTKSPQNSNKKPRKKSIRLDTDTPQNKRKSKRIEITESTNNRQRKKSKRIETTSHSPNSRRKSKRIDDPNNNDKNRRKSKRIDSKNEDKNRRKSKRIEDTYRRKSKRIDSNSHSPNSKRRKSKNINESEKLRRKSKRIENDLNMKKNRRKSKRIEENKQDNKSLKKESDSRDIPKSYTKGVMKITKTVYAKDKYRNNDILLDVRGTGPERPRSKSPQPQYNYISQPNKPDRPRSKSPLSINRLNDRDEKIVYKSRSKSPIKVKENVTQKVMNNSDMYRLYECIKRVKWNVGSKVEIFSVSQSLWLRGKVVKVLKDREGEFLTVVYSDKQKTLERKNEHLRAIQIDLNDENIKEKTKMFIKKHERYKEEKEMRDKNEIFYVAMKCEIKDPKYGWSWCQITEVFRDNKGEFVTVVYKVYDVMNNEAHFKKYSLPISFKHLKRTLPRDISSTLHTQWRIIYKQNVDYPQKSTNGHLEAVNLELSTIGQFYKKFNIKRSEEIPKQFCALIESQKIKMYPILIFDLENTLIPSKLIKSIMRKNDISSTKELFKNFDHWCYSTEYKYLKQLQRIMKQTAETMNTFINNFRGKIIIYSENEYYTWNNLINYLPESAGGDLWRDIYKKIIRQNNIGDVISIFACKSVYKQQYSNINNGNNQSYDIDDIIASKQLILENYFKSIQMNIEFERLKDETYYIPIIFAIGDDKSDQIAASQATHVIFQNFYRLINFELVKNKLKIGDKTLSDNILYQSLYNTMNHSYIQQFMTDNNKHTQGNIFIKSTWHGLFSGDCQYMHQVEKI